MNTSLKLLGWMAGIIVVAAGAATAAEPAGTRPNIVFIITDQQFGDALSCRIGTQYLRTPGMDRIAAGGTFFTRAYSANPLCMPSRNSMFTGRYPHETGVTKNATAKFDPADFVDMGTYLRTAGYHTAYYGKRHLCFRLERGFEFTATEPKKEHDAATLAGALQFINEKHQQPFFMVVSFMNPHNVCELARGQGLPDGPIGAPPAADQCPPAPANLAPQLNEPDTMTIMRQGYHASTAFPVGKFTPDQWRQLRWGYYRLIEKVDAQIGQVLDAMEKTGAADNTVFIFTSDHGECAGAHGFNQKTVFYEESARVPLIVSYKGHTKPGTCDNLANTGIDILPTVLDFAGVAQPAKLPGRSLRALAMGETAPSWRDHVIVEDNMDQAASIGPFRPSAEGRMVRSQRYKYCIYNRGERRESLVDLEADPGETKNLAGDANYRAVLLEHRALLAKFAKEHNDPLAAQMLAEDVKPMPFKAGDGQEQEQRRPRKREK